MVSAIESAETECNKCGSWSAYEQNEETPLRQVKRSFDIKVFEPSIHN